MTCSTRRLDWVRYCRLVQRFGRYFVLGNSLLLFQLASLLFHVPLNVGTSNFACCFVKTATELKQGSLAQPPEYPQRHDSDNKNENTKQSPNLFFGSEEIFSYHHNLQAEKAPQSLLFDTPDAQQVAGRLAK